MTVRAICFDIDDTLYPYAEYARPGLRAAADRLETITGRRLHNELADLYFEEGITSHIFDRLVGRYDTIDSSVTAELVDAYHDTSTDLDPYDDTVTILELLRDHHRLGVLGSGRNPHEKLSRLGLGEYFDTVVSTARLDTSKRDAEPFERLCSALSVDSSRTIYVGDDPRIDFVVPNHLQMGTVRVRRGRYAHLVADGEAGAPDVEIDRLAELPALLEASRLD